MKIYGSKAKTKGGGELHIDASGHFMHRFRNVPMKLSRMGTEGDPLFDLIELEPLESSRLHVNVLYEQVGKRMVQITITDTYMMGMEVKPDSDYLITDIEGDNLEHVHHYHLQAGRHYYLNIFYFSSEEHDEHLETQCPKYDLTLSISHDTELIEESKCKDGQFESLTEGLKHVITDRDLDGEGKYHFNKVLKLQYPNDFKKLTKHAMDNRDVLFEKVSIDLSHNYDIRASVDFEFDQGLFTLELEEAD